MSITILGGFLVVHEQHAVALSAIQRLRTMGREDEDHPMDREVQLVADIGTEVDVTLGRYRKFREAEAEMQEILRQIGRYSAGDEVVRELREVSRRLGALEEHPEEHRRER